MSLNISTIDLTSFRGSGEIVISANKQANASASIKSAGIFHKIKTALGFSSAKAANAATIDAIRTAIRNDKRLFMASDTANRLLGEVRGTITADKVRSILDTLKNEVNGLVDVNQSQVVNGSQTERNFKNAAVKGLKGRLAAQSAPKFLRNLGLHKNQDFMKWYAGVASETAVKAVYSDTITALKNELNELKTELSGLKREKTKLFEALKNETNADKIAELQGKITAKETEISNKNTEVENKQAAI